MLSNNAKEWFYRMVRFTWHRKYHDYSDVWLQNSTVLQREYIESWSRGFMSPSVDPEAKDLSELI